MCVCVCVIERETDQEREIPVYRLLTFCTRKQPFNNSSSLLNKHPRIGAEDGSLRNQYTRLPPDGTWKPKCQLSQTLTLLRPASSLTSLNSEAKMKHRKLIFLRSLEEFPNFFFWSWNLISDAHHGAIKTHPTAETDIMSLKRRCKGWEIGSLREAMLNESEAVGIGTIYINTRWISEIPAASL